MVTQMTSKQLYNYYKEWLGKAVFNYRSCDDEDKERWLMFMHRCSSLTEVWLKISKNYEVK